jgi:hypothetical protein
MSFCTRADIICSTYGTKGSEGVVTQGVSVPMAESDERPEVEDMAVAAGKRMK